MFIATGQAFRGRGVRVSKKEEEVDLDNSEEQENLFHDGHEKKNKAIEHWKV